MHFETFLSHNKRNPTQSYFKRQKSNSLRSLQVDSFHQPHVQAAPRDPSKAEIIRSHGTFTSTKRCTSGNSRSRSSANWPKTCRLVGLLGSKHHHKPCVRVRASPLFRYSASYQLQHQAQAPSPDFPRLCPQAIPILTGTRSRVCLQWHQCPGPVSAPSSTPQCPAQTRAHAAHTPPMADQSE
jgi:hypothetical protein